MRLATPQIDNIWLRRNGFTRLDNPFDFPIEFECKLCYLISNFRECSRCSAKYYQKIKNVSVDRILVTWIKYV